MLDICSLIFLSLLQTFHFINVHVISCTSLNLIVVFKVVKRCLSGNVNSTLEVIKLLLLLLLLLFKMTFSHQGIIVLFSLPE